MQNKTIGVLALQGDFEKHATALEKSGVLVKVVKGKEDLSELNGLVIPGGESTTIGKLLLRFKLFEELKTKIKEGLPVFGTCAGLIILAKEIIGYKQPSLELLDIAVARNAYGPQIMSFEVDLAIPLLGPKPLRAVFIRAPIIKRVGQAVKVIASFESYPVLIQQANILATSFHPELTDDFRLHHYFLKEFIK